MHLISKMFNNQKNLTNLFVYIFITLEMFALLFNLFQADKKLSATATYTFKT